ncbi:Y+L amino acid transporter 2 [Diaphorina citri]|uniref:Y+L amino acid transporter 2 n=1 Tax=Diaphorina citri TaxID=121845 RepID=A0A1S4EED5_DIACI|nr:Y+L amino acid transporter 2 [Diaphorina citri]
MSCIFISPTGVVIPAGSVGLSLTVWVLCGVMYLHRSVGLSLTVWVLCGVMSMICVLYHILSLHSMFFTGIFISPAGVVIPAGSVGLSLTVWVLCGVMSMIGALCYAELGTSIPKSGGDYAYLFEAFGPLPAFLYLWDAMLIFVPTTNAIMGLTFANYVVKPFFHCENPPPDVAIRLIAASVICLLTFINCYNVRATTRLQNVFMFAKIAALVVIIIMGIGFMAMYGSPQFEDPWKNTETNVGKIAVSFYAGIFSYSGWNYLNFMTEELKNPYVNLPRAIYISLPIVTFIYTLANVAYFAVVPPALMSDAIAVTFANQVMGVFAWTMPFMVALSALGGLSVHIMTSSRMCFVGARYGHFPAMLSHINISRFTPTPSLVFLNILSLFMLFTSDVFLLITYSSFVESAFIMISVCGILYLRYTQPDMHRPIKVSLWVPISFVLICVFLVVTPILEAPREVGMAVLITLSGVPVYLIGVKWRDKPEAFTRSFNALTYFVQKLFLSALFPYIFTR